MEENISFTTFQLIMGNIMQAIQTRFMPPTNTRGSRIKATCPAKSIIVDWMDNLDIEENDRYAAKELMKELKWYDLDMHTGQLKDGSFVHVLIKKTVIK